MKRGCVVSIHVLKEILEWSLNRPTWQRDALRRLIANGELNDMDIIELANLCKSRHGLAERENAAPLNTEHLPQPRVGSDLVSLESLTHHCGVNALAHDQTIEFGPSLTVVYGANAAGKSGYTRILKRACRARGTAEEILGNVVSTTIPRPSATIKFTVDGKPLAHLWDDNQPPNHFLSRVSVFDRHCAGVYVGEQTDVAFRPMGLDLFDKLSDACEDVKRILERERNALESQQLRDIDVADGTVVYELITNLTSLTDPASVKELAALTEVDRRRIEELRTRFRDLQSADPEQTARTIELRARRAATLVARVSSVDEVLSDISVKELFKARDRMDETRRATEDLRSLTFQRQPLSNTGSDTWRTLWDAARRFSTVDAYPDAAFPFTEDGSRCVLCQQKLADESVRRLQQFKEFFESAIQGEYDNAADTYREKHLEISEERVLDEPVREALYDIQLDDLDLAEETRVHLAMAEARRQELNKALTENGPFPQNLPFLTFNVEMTHPP